MGESLDSVPTLTGWKARLLKPVQVGGRAARLPRPVRRRLAGILGVQPGQRVLEYGCGTGPNLGVLRSLVGPSGVVVGLEAVTKPLENARGLVGRKQWENVTVVAGDDLDPARLGPFDAVLFNLGYSLLPDRDRLLDQAWGLVRDGRRMVILDCGSTGPIGRRLVRLLDLAGEVYGPLPDPARWAGLSRLSPTLSIEFGSGAAYCLVTIEKTGGEAPPAIEREQAAEI